LNQVFKQANGMGDIIEEDSDTGDEEKRSTYLPPTAQEDS